MGQLSVKSNYFNSEILEPYVKKGDSTLCKHVFKWDYDMNTNNWPSYVNSLFDLCNLYNFENHTNCSIDLCYEKLCDIENIN